MRKFMTSAVGSAKFAELSTRGSSTGALDHDLLAGITALYTAGRIDP